MSLAPGLESHLRAASALDSCPGDVCPYICVSSYLRLCATDTVAGVSTDPLGLRAHAPVLEAYGRFSESDPIPFTIPGHKQRTDLIGDVIRGDVPLYAGLDTMKVDHGTLARAQRLAAELWGADWARFSVGGSTHGNQALALAIGQPGDEVVVGGTLHRSMLLGLVLADLRPVWVHPDIDASTGLPLGYSAADVDAALVDHPDAGAVFLGDPSYVGTFGDVSAIANVTHRHDAVLMIDAAWGAHFGFHPALAGLFARWTYPMVVRMSE